MSVSTSSFDSEVGQDGVNIFDLTIDATSTACLDIADLMVSKDSKLMSESTSFQVFFVDTSSL